LITNKVLKSLADSFGAFLLKLRYKQANVSQWSYQMLHTEQNKLHIFAGVLQFNVSELAGQNHSRCNENFTLNKTIQPDQSSPKQYAKRRWVFGKYF